MHSSKEGKRTARERTAAKEGAIEGMGYCGGKNGERTKDTAIGRTRQARKTTIDLIDV